MKLRRKNISLLEHCHERGAVTEKSAARLAGIEGSVGVREIEIGVLRDAFQQFTGTRAAQLIPSHVRQAIGRRQSGNFLRKQREARVSGRFVAGGEHGLESETNSEQRRTARNCVSQRLYQRTLA